MATRPAYVWTGSDWDDIGDKRVGALGASVTAVNSDLAKKIDYATPTNLQTGATYTFVSDDVNRITTASAGASALYTVPPQSSVTWAANAILRLVNYGAGSVTVEGGSGVTVQNTATTIGEFESAAVIRKGSDDWTLVPFGSKASSGPSADSALISDTPTGTYTDSGIDYAYWTYNSTGTLNVTQAGFADVLVVGGGGGGAREFGSGGGGGGMLEGTDVYFPSGAATVVVGAGGAAGIQLASGYVNDGSPGAPSMVFPFVSPGGGGGVGSIFNGTTYLGRAGQPGGSGGGGAGGPAGGTFTGGSGLTSLGNAGGDGRSSADAGGGGGAGGVGGNSTNGVGGAGGAGKASSITGTSTTLAGGGGGGGNTGGAAGSGGGGAAGGTTANAGSGSANTGGGGGGTRNAGFTAGSGGSGVVIVRVRTN